MKNWFTELNAINVNDHVKQKHGLTYLSWMWAWIELKKRYPLSYFTVHETEDGMLVWKDPIGGHTKTSVTIVWEEEDGLKEHTVTEYLPVMDLRNNSVPYDNIDSMMVNKTIQRGLTKCIARLGLGAYIFVSEDNPEEDKMVAGLQAEIASLAAKKAKLSDKAKEQVAKLCKDAEREANPDLKDELISGNYMNIDDSAILDKLKKNLTAIRK